MRLITFISLFILSLGCAGTRNAARKLSGLNGTWKPLNEEMGGTPLPPSAFESQRLIINDTNYTLTAESIDKGVVKCNGNKMDIYGKEGTNAGRHITAIYQYKNGDLTICYNLIGNHYPEAFDTKGKPTYFLAVFEKE